MGILNATPDSFYSDSRVISEEQVRHKATAMVAAGADIIDIGGYSTRPGAEEVSVQEELDRTCHAIELVAQLYPEQLISVDTFRSEVARAAVAAGASMVNDVSGGSLDAEMYDTVASLRVPYVLMHMRGTPQTMTSLNQYEDLLTELIDFFAAKIRLLRAKGVHDLIIDPGFGFAKDVRQNFEVLRRLPELAVLDCPLLVGVSRKSMIWRTLEIEPEAALNGSTVLHTIALQQGASILRVHDVREAQEVVTLMNQIYS